jgi:hypothetical protein
MPNDSSAIVQKVWNYAHVLKNAGVGYGDYVEQITYLLFLKLADEMTELGFYPPTPKGSGATSDPIPEEFRWPNLVSKSGDELEVHYRHTLENLGTEPGLVGIIFRKAQNKISNPSDLQRVIKMIADEDWSGINKLSPSACSCVERSLGKGFDLLQSAGPQSPYRNERTRVDFHELQSACHPLKTQDRPEQLHFLQQGSFSGPPLHDVLQGFIKVFRDDGTQHSEVLFVLPTGLVETKQAMAFALEKEDRVHDRYPIDGDGSLHHLFDSVLGNPKDTCHEVHLPIAGAIEREDPELAIRRGSALDQRAVIRLGFKVTKSGETQPDVAVLGREGTKTFEAVYGGFSTEVFRPEVHRLPTLEEINFPGGSKVSQKSEEVDESVIGRHHLPSDSARFSIFASLKKTSGKIEFSRCSIMGSSPAASRAASSRRDAAFSASRAFRSNGFFSDMPRDDSRPARGSQTRAASGMTASSLNPNPAYLS